LRQYKKNNLSGPLPLPVVGNLMGLAMYGISGYFTEMTRKYGKNFMYFEGSTPILATADVEFVKQITIKDMKAFPMRRVRTSSF